MPPRQRIQPLRQRAARRYAVLPGKGYSAARPATCGAAMELPLMGSSRR
jgi:hypothetical protein